MHQLILASQSSRRRDLLHQEAYRFTVDPVKLSEIIDKNLNCQENVEAIAKQKALAYMKQAKLLKGQGFLILSADTMVEVEGQMLGKPKNSTEARYFLQQLSNKVHSVITGVFILDVDKETEISRSMRTQVWFRDLSEAEISAYVASGEPFDKAGGYGIQGQGQSFVLKIEGSYSNVVGFPLELFRELETQNGWQIRL